MRECNTSMTPAISLRPYQQTCVERAIALFRRKAKGGRALIVLPTGTGKTLVFAEIARRMGLTTLIIAHRQELLYQAAEKFRLVDPTASIGQVGAGKHEWGAPITIASVQAISRPGHLALAKISGYDLVIIDECHHSAACGYQTVLDQFPDAFVLGVTATPDRMDKQSIEQIFGAPIFSTSILDMVEQGYLSNLRAIAIQTEVSLDHLHMQAGDFKQDELAVAVDTPERNECVVAAYLRHCNGRQSLCFGVAVSHAEHLATAFNEQGIPAAMVCGATPQEERKRILSDYERGTLRILSNCGVLTEGYDAPQTSCIIMARPTQSRALYVQCIGRGTRLAPGKTDCIILDITDNTLKHRLEPLSLKDALDITLHDGESILEAQEREKLELAEQQAKGDPLEKQKRTVLVSQREYDFEVDLLNRMAWQRRLDGAYCMVVGAQKHRIVLLPSKTVSGYYSVRASLAPTFKEQCWLHDAPLEWAMQHAEMKTRLLLSQKRMLVDNTMPWRSRSVTPKQRFMLRKFHIPFTPAMTSGEAADLIGKAIEDGE